MNEIDKNNVVVRLNSFDLPIIEKPVVTVDHNQVSHKSS